MKGKWERHERIIIVIFIGKWHLLFRYRDTRYGVRFVMYNIIYVWIVRRVLFWRIVCVGAGCRSASNVHQSMWLLCLFDFLYHYNNFHYHFDSLLRLMMLFLVLLQLLFSAQPFLLLRFFIFWILATRPTFIPFMCTIYIYIWLSIISFLLYYCRIHSSSFFCLP